MSQPTPTTVTATGVLTDPVNPIAGQTVTVNFRVSGTPTFAVFGAPVTTDATGAYSVVATAPAGTYDFQAVFASTGVNLGATVEVDGFVVPPHASITLNLAAS